MSGTSIVDRVYSIKIPVGTMIYEGPVGYQGGMHLGGIDKEQIFINEAWKINGLEVINNYPLK